MTETDLFKRLAALKDPVDFIVSELSQIKGATINITRFDGITQPLFFLPATQSGYPKILFTSHLDVACGYPSDIRIENGMICGNNVGADDRAGTTAIMTALAKLPLCHGDVYALFTKEEEKGCLGAKAFFAENDIPFDYVFSIDGNGEIGSGFYPYYKALGFQIESGDDSRFRFEQVESEALSVKAGELVECKGGYAFTLVVRSSKYAELKNYFERIKKETGANFEMASKEKGYVTFPSHRIKVRKDFGYLPETENDGNIIRLAKLACENHNFEIKRSLVGGSDATIAAEYGYKSLILNSGALDAHTEKERVRIEDIKSNVEMIRRLVEIKERY